MYRINTPANVANTGRVHIDTGDGVQIEQERRANLAAIPAQIAELAGKFRDGGGDEGALIGALTPEEQDALEA